DFHSDDSFSGSLHFAQYAYNRVRIRVHVRTNRVDAHQIDLHPGRLGGGAQRFDAVAGASMGPDNSFLLGFGKNVHDAAVALGPIAFSEAVHQADIDVVGAQLFAKTVEIGAGLGGIARPGLGEHGNLVAAERLERLGHVRMAAVGIGGVEEAQAV